MIYFTADTHFGHANIIKYAKRPFANVDAMDEALVHNWNSIVGASDTIYHLGDFSFSKNPGKYFHRLNGNKYLISGNHDKRNVLDLPWNGVHSYLEVYVDGEKVILFHYGCRVWNGSHHGRIQLYGHSHGGLPGNSQSCDIGVDCWDYKPVVLSQIRKRLLTLPKYKQEDYHEAR